MGSFHLPRDLVIALLCRFANRFSLPLKFVPPYVSALVETHDFSSLPLRIFSYRLALRRASSASSFKFFRYFLMYAACFFFPAGDDLLKACRCADLPQCVPSRLRLNTH